MHSNKLKLLSIAAALTVLSACNKYAIDISDKVVYTPAPLFSDYDIADSALATCVSQTILDQKITAAQQLTRLVCTSAGIKNLQGLARFKQLRELNLSGNRIETVQALPALTQLQSLDLSGNQLTGTGELLLMQNLSYLNLTDNPKFSCDQDLTQFQAFYHGELLLPTQCSETH